MPIIFFVENYFKNEFKSPTIIGKKFAYWYMVRDPYMKTFASKKIHKKIDRFCSSNINLHSEWIDYYDYLELSAFQRLGDLVVASYIFNDYPEEPFVYSVVLQPIGPVTLWERFKFFLFFKLHLGDLPYLNQRWLVVDYYSNDNFEQYIESLKSGAVLSQLIMSSKKTLEEFIMDYTRQDNFEDIWSKEEKFKQNSEVKKLNILLRAASNQ